MAKPRERRNAPGSPDGAAAESDLASAAAGMTDDEFPAEDGSTPGPDDTMTDNLPTDDQPSDDTPDSGDAPSNAPIAEASNTSIDKTPKKKRKKTGPFKVGCPAIPSFDHTKGKPNLHGEDVAAEGKTPGGIKFVVTTGARKIFLCSIVRYEKEFGQLVPRELWIEHFPAAAPKGKK